MSKMDKKGDFSSKMAYIDSKYDSFIHFTIKFSSKDYSIRKPGYQRPLISGQPIYARVFQDVLGISWYTQYSRLPEIWGFPEMLGMPKIWGNTHYFR